MTSNIAFVDLMSQQHKADPFPYYAQLRAEAPVHKTMIHGIGDVWLITRYDDVVAVLKDRRFAKDPRNAGRRVREPEEWEIKIMSNNLLRYDDPNHRRVRGLTAKALKRCGIEHLAGRIAAVTDELLSAMAGRSEADLLHDFAHPLPLIAISDLMGIPREDHDKMPKWIEQATSPSGPPDMVILSEFLRYLQRLTERRREDPQDDLISALVAAESDGDRLTPDELVATATALIIAGHETAVNLISSGAMTLMQHPDELEKLKQDPGLAASAVEEMLRYSAPVESATERFAVEDAEMHGAHIARGDLLLAVIASANRDAEIFVDPDRFDIARTPNPHVAFGSGAHYCMGAPFAQMQAEIAFRKLFERFPAMTIAAPSDRLPWKQMPILRGLEALPVRF